MRLIDSRKILSVFSLCLLLLSFSPAAFSTSANSDWLGSSTSTAQPSAIFMLAESENFDADNEKPRSGSLVLPAAVEDEKDEKKCMTVCQRWGQECMIDTTRGVRKCRRTCKEFGQECF
jgi:hypothetical protein